MNYCRCCNKNDAPKIHKVKVTVGAKTEERVEHYCLECYYRLFISGKETLTCPVCGQTAEAFKKSKLVGCAECYKTLYVHVTPVIAKMQGLDGHCGKQLDVSEREKLARRVYELESVSAAKKDGEAEDVPYLKEIKALRARLATMKKGD